MLMPKLSRGATRVSPIGRLSSGLRLSSNTYTAYCVCTCLDGTKQCAAGTSRTSQDDAKVAAHQAAGALCSAHGGVDTRVAPVYPASCP